MAPLLSVPTDGVRPDLDEFEVPANALREAENWLRRSGKFRVRPGQTAFASNTAQRPTALIQYTHHDLTTRVVMGTVSSWWRYNAGTNAWVDLAGTALTASATQLQVFRPFSKAGSTHLLGVNGKDAPMKWDGAAATYSAIGGSPPIARCMMVVADRVILGNLSSGGTQSPVAIDVSALSDFDTGWGSVLVKVLGEVPGEIIAMQELGFLQGAIYLDQAIAIAIAQDGLVPFRFDFRRQVKGPVSSQAVVPIGEGTHAYLGNDSAVYIFDGTVPRSLGLAVQRQIAKTITTDRLPRSWVAWDSDQQLLYVVYTAIGGTEPTRGVVIAFPGGQCYPIRWNGLSPTCGMRLSIPSGLTIGDLGVPIGDLGMTLAEMDTLVPRFVIGNITGQAYHDAGLTDAGASIPAYFETGLQRLSEGDRFATITDVQHFFKTSGGTQKIRVRLGSSDYGEERVLEDDPTGTENELDLANGGPYYTGHRLSTQAASLRVEADATQAIEWDGSHVTVPRRGYR
jgi:hypothetical protein